MFICSCVFAIFVTFLFCCSLFDCFEVAKIQHYLHVSRDL
nr:MAG TPA_asm: hypothetical protein [Caudoviricetes sp.]